MTIRRLIHGLLVLVMMSILVACKSESQALMRIGPKTITDEQFLNYMQVNTQTMQAMQGQGMSPETIRQQLFDQMLLEEVALYEASLNGAGIDTNDNVAAYQLLGQASGTEQKLTYNDMETFAKSYNFASATDLRQFLNRRTTLDDYAKTVQVGRDPYVDIRLIQITFTPSDTAEIIEERRLEAESVLQQLKNGAAFEDLALQYSDDPTAQSGGAVGGFLDVQLLKANVDETLGQVLATLPLNTPSDVTRGPNGWYIFEVLDRSSFASATNPNQPFWFAMLEDQAGLLYLQTRIEQYQSDGTLQVSRETLETIPVEINAQSN